MKKYFISLSISIILSIIMIFVLSILISKTSLSEKIIKPATITITSISIFIGAFLVSKEKKEKGLINGIVLGLSYIVILYLFSIILNRGFYISSSSILMIFIGVIGGIVGGILGVNFK